MKQSSYVALIAASLSLWACGQAESNASGIVENSSDAQEQPKQVESWVNERKNGCVSDGFKFEKAENFFKTADFNGDGKRDYALWDGGIICAERPASWFGNAGPPISLLISNGDDYEFSDGFNVPDLDELLIQRENGKDVIIIGGTQGGEYRQVTWSWNGSDISPKEQSWAIGPTLSSSDYEWSLEEEGGISYAGYGTAEGGAEYVLECEKGMPTISLSNGEAGLYESDFVEMDVDGKSSFVGKTTITQDTEYFTATVAISTSAEIFTDLIAGETPWRVKWNKGAIDELTNGPKLQGFITKCRERGGS